MQNTGKINQRLHHFTDDRSLQEIKDISYKIQKISKTNQQKFSTQQQLKKNTKPIQDKVAHILKRYDLNRNKGFCHYTDNIDAHSYFQQGQNGKIAVFTMHGCPGNHLEWMRLEKSTGSNFIRWINFVMPGFDGYDERRGEYKGTGEDICKMIVQLIKHLKILKIIFIGHSMGSYTCYLFAKMYPELIYGFVESSAAPITWYLGMEKYIQCIVDQFSDESLWSEKLDTDDSFRQTLYEQYVKNLNNYEIDMPNVGKLNMLPLKIEEFCASIKFFSRTFGKNTGWSQMFNLHRQFPTGLKLFAAGNTDIIMEKKLFEKTFEYFTFGEKALINNEEKGKIYQKQFIENIIKNSNDEQLKSIDFDFDNFQSNFIFLFENTGHPVHNRRGKELGNPLKVYIKILDLVSLHQQKQNYATTENDQTNQKLMPSL